MKTFYEYFNRKSKSINLILFFLILLSFCSLRTYATIRYVKQTATGLGNGTSWANASNNLQAMIDASSANDEVWVMAGTYKPNAYPTGSSGGTTPRDYAFILKNQVKVYGGFVGNETLLNQRTQAVIAANPSILSGDIGAIGDDRDNTYHLFISVNTDSTTVLNGFTIVNGYADDYLGTTIIIDSKGIRRGNGSGIYNIKSSTSIINCNFKNCNSRRGGGIFNDYFSSPIISNCSFIQNSAGLFWGGGGIANNYFSSPLITNCVFWGNHAAGGGAIENNAESNPTIINCTFVKNSVGHLGSAYYKGAGIFDYQSRPIVRNCIFWENRYFNGLIVSIEGGIEGDSAIVSYSDIHGGYTGSGNINKNPLFVNANDPDGADNIFGNADDGLALQLGSPAINTGDNTGITATTDITGAARIQNTTIDMGAYESPYTVSQPRLYVKANATGINNGTSWANAFTDLQSALDNQFYDEIWVAAGTYKPTKDPFGNASPTDLRDRTFYLQNTKKLYGGFEGTETLLSQRTQAIIATNPSILSGDIGIVNDSTDNVYHVVLSVNDNSSTILDGFTVTKGNAFLNTNWNSINLEAQNINRASGGGMINIFSSPTISNCIFLANSASEVSGVSSLGIGAPLGGGLSNISSSPTITNCSFIANNSAWGGGGIWNVSSSPTISNCSFSVNNATSAGGGINNNNSTPTISNCKFYNNTAGFGAGLINYASSSNINNCSFFGNTAKYFGGGMTNENSYQPIITNCTFSANTADGGAGMYSTDSSPKITNCAFSKNTSVFGGGMLIFYASPIITNCSFFNNNVSLYGGGIDMSSYSNPIIRNSIFWGNKKGIATDVLGADIEVRSNAVATITYSALQMTNNTANYPSNGIQGNGLGNIYAKDPLFVNSNDPDGTDNIFGTEDDGLALQPVSPAINTGDNTGITATTDVTGAVRIQNTIIDMGAYESPFSRNQYSVASEPCSSDLIWIQGGVITCNGKAKMTIKVLGLKVNTVAEFSIDNVNWYDATEGGNTYTFTVPQQGICRSFWARPKGCNDSKKVIWGCYLDTYAGYPVICTDGQIPTASQPLSLRTTNFSMNESETMSVETMPNPVNDNLIVKIYLPKNTSIKTTLISNIGREMETRKFEGKAGENNLMFDVTSYKSGLYILWVQSDESRIIKKIIKID